MPGICSLWFVSPLDTNLRENSQVRFIGVYRDKPMTSTSDLNFLNLTEKSRSLDVRMYFRQ